MAKVLKDVEGAFEIRNAERKNQGLPLLPIPGRKAVASAIGRLDPFYVRARRMSVDILKRAMALAGGRIVHDEIGLLIEIDEWERWKAPPPATAPSRRA